MKTAIVLMLIAVLVALASAGVFMLRKGKAGESRSNHMARSEARRPDHPLGRQIPAAA